MKPNDYEEVYFYDGSFSAGMLFFSCSKEDDIEIMSHPKVVHPMEPSIEECDIVNDSLLLTDVFKANSVK